MENVAIASSTVHRIMSCAGRIRPAHAHPTTWMIRLLVADDPLALLEPQFPNASELSILAGFIRNRRPRERKKAMAVIASWNKVPHRIVTDCLQIPAATALRYLRIFNRGGTASLFFRRRRPCTDTADEKKAIFALLHCPPSLYSINRTSWKMEDLHRVLNRSGQRISYARVRRIIKASGFRWRKAKIVLTSRDPSYDSKLNAIKQILSNLQEDEAFFSIDEFGPFAIKHRQGRKLVGPGETYFVPQRQNSRGWLIITAALELSRNRVTHFYSLKKNTDEMIRMAELLRTEYQACRTVYLSWDAASWHVSKRLFSRIASLNLRPAQDGYLQAPQLASVLFNCEAAASVRRNSLGQKSMLDLTVTQLNAKGSKGADRHLPEGTFEVGSEIVKLVWEILPATQQFALFDPENVPIEAGTNQLFRVPSWLSRYSLDPDTSKSCPAALPPYGSPDQPVPVPINCFYWFKVRGADNCESLSKEVIQVWCQAPIENEDFYAVLVAFHVMKLVATNPNWIWMTYYWTRNDNDAETGSGVKWAAPWRHFHEFSTTAIREEAPVGHKICFNPYLEGTDFNGVKANCLSCHTFSAYSPTASKVNDGTKRGAIYPYALSQRQSDERKYFAGSVQTGFVWSISTNQDLTTAALLTSFQTAIATAILDQPR